LHPETNASHFAYEPIAKLLDPNNTLKLPIVDGEIAPEIRRTIRVKAWLRSVEIGKQIMPPSNNLVKAILDGARAALEDYEAGNRTKAELPRVGEIMTALIKVSPAIDPSLHSYLAKLNASGIKIIQSMLELITYGQAKLTPQELTQFCTALGLQDVKK
jgi:hypothetical protein